MFPFAASYDIVTPGGTETVTANQRIEGGRWHLLKTITLAANDNWKVELSDQSPGEVVADAVAIMPPLTLTDRFDWSPTLPSAGDYAVYAKWQAAADRATDATYEVTHSGGVAAVTVDQRHNGGEWRYLGTWSFDPSQSPQVRLLASLNGTVNADAVRFVSGDAIGGDIAYTHSDQIGTIQKLTDASGALVWDRIARPFGETVSINAASGADQKLRFPGQYADETGISYNYFRDYDPTLGRYVQSDPIGLRGGINTYTYARNNPVNKFDKLGLDVTVIINNNGIGHAGVYVDGPNGKVLYDPGGSYHANERGSGDALWNEDISKISHGLGDYITFQMQDGLDMEIFQFKTTREQDKEIMDNIEKRGGCSGFLCAVCVGDVIRGVGPFENLDSAKTPDGLADGLDDVQGGGDAASDGE